MTNNNARHEDDPEPASVVLENLALDNCEREPVQIPGRVQTFGGLIACDVNTMRVVGYSENFDQIVPEVDGLALNADFGELFEDHGLVHSIRGALSLPTVSIQRERIGVHSIGDHFFDVAVSVSEAITAIEFEKVAVNKRRPDTSVAAVRSMLASLPTSGGATELLESAVKSLRRLTGFDRVMGYQFLEDGSGEVVAEARGHQIEPYLGLRYPASDIPQIVRKLMIVNPFRVIGDIHDPHAMLIKGSDALPLNLSLTHVRGVSPIHVEYLQNMGVSSTMSVSLILHGQLWGLFSLHHYHPFVLPPEKRSIVELFGQLISMQLRQQLDQEVLDQRKRANLILKSLNEPKASSLAELFQSSAQDFPKILSCEGAAIINRDSVMTWGRCPETKVIEALARLSEADTHAVSSLVGIADPSQTNGICGAAMIRFSQSADSWLLLFRPEQIETVRWAGDTSKRIERGPDGPRLHPRASFDEYAQSVRGKCLPWSKPDIEAAIQIAAALRDAAFSSLDEGQKAWEKQNQHKDLLIAELNHRVKNVLTLVQSIARQTQKSSSSLTQYAESFEKRIGALSTAHDLIGGTSLQRPGMRELLKTELRAFESASRAVKMDGPDVALNADIVPLLALMFHELVSNAVKYGALSDAGERLEVSWQEEAGGLAITWSEFLQSPIENPTRRGFGMTLIERLVPHECNGTCDLRFEKTGLKARFWLPSDSAGASEAGVKSSTSRNVAQPESHRIQSDGTAIMIVEDDTVLAMELESFLVASGYPNVVVFNGVDSCQWVLNSEPNQRAQLPDIAILDINLGQTTSFAFAERLKEKGVALIMISGYDVGFASPSSLADVPRLRKPINHQQLLGLISAAGGSRK